LGSSRAETIPPSPLQPAARETHFGFPFVSLLGGALAMAISPIFVRLSDVGPFTSAFWRVAGALPLLWIWAAAEARHAGEPMGAAFRFDRAIVIAGLLFAADLLFWHLST